MSSTSKTATAETATDETVADVAVETPATPDRAAGAKAEETVLGTTNRASLSAAEEDTAAEDRGHRKTRRGLVVSDKMTKTVVVTVEDRVKHPLYGKVLRRTSRVKAHDENSVAGVGDLVLIMETRPLSASKRWRVVEILEKAK